MSSFSLTISTSSLQGSITLAKEDNALDTVLWKKESSHSERLTVEIQSLFRKHKIELNDLKFCICTNGPGSFTGLRVGLSAIRGLAYSAQASVFSISDLHAIALNTLTTKNSLPVVVITDAQKNKFFVGLYSPDLKKEILSPCLLDLQELKAKLFENNYLALGDGLEFAQELFPQSLQKKLYRDEKLSHFPFSENIFHFVIQNRNLIPKKTWDQLFPYYLRASSAEEVLAQKMGNKL